MDITIYPRKLSGNVCAIPSKSQAHRILICAAFSDSPVTIHCPQTNRDIDATVGCLRALGADITKTENGYIVLPIRQIPQQATLNCNESGSTLRFMLPICAAFGVDTLFQLSGRLPERPLSPLWDELERMGCSLSRPTKDTIRCQGQLQSGDYTISGRVSSQFITGLLFALALLPGDSTLKVTGKIESKPYITMTEKVLNTFGVKTDDYHFSESYPFHSPGQIEVEGDWSNAAFFLAARVLGNPVNVTGLNTHSAQGDRICQKLFDELRDNITISGEDIPDLIPILAIVSGAKNGAEFQNISRLRLKESDRIEAVAQMLRTLGASVQTSENSMIVSPAQYEGGIIDAHNDHRIAMSAAIASTVSVMPITITGADCVKKSYPEFWSEFSRLGGYYEQYLR